MNKLLLIPLLAAAAAARCPAQIPFPLPPKAPDKAEWLVTFGKPADTRQPDQPEAAGVSRILISRHVTKDGGTKQIVETYGNGVRRESWLLGQLFLFQVPENEDIYIRDIASGYSAWLPPMASGDDFPELAWVGAGNLKGEDAVDGRPCLVFESTTEVAATGGKNRSASEPLMLGGPPAEAVPMKTIQRKAWLDKATGLPVRASEGPAVYRFAEQPKPLGAVPEAYKAVAVNLIQQKKDMEKHRMRVR